MNYGYVNKGDRIRKASASRYRDVTRLLNRLERPSDRQENLNNSNVEIMVMNMTDEPLPVYSPVEITDVLEALTDNTVNRPVFQVKKANSDSRHLAVTQEYLPVNGIGSALVIGVTPAKVKINSEADQYAAVASDGTLASASDGLLRILARDKESSWTILQLGGGGKAAEEYTGYFKLVLLETEGEENNPQKYFVDIVDGATYDPTQKPVSGKSVCKVNNVTYQLDPYESGEITETSVFALKYTAPVAADPDAGTEAEPAKVEIVNLQAEGYDVLPSDSSEICWYQLGRAVVSTNTDGTLNVTVQQDHLGTASNGIPQIFWYGLCEG